MLAHEIGILWAPTGMKWDIIEYISLRDTYQSVKVEHQRPARILQPLKILEWKWEEIGMDFMVVLCHTWF
jgi:hypothetical protein